MLIWSRASRERACSGSSARPGWEWSVLSAGLLPALANGVSRGAKWGQSDQARRAPLAELERALGSAPSGRLVLAVDQLEEVFTVCGDEAERRRFFEQLAAEASDQRLVVVAIRADFYGSLADYPELAALLADNHVLVGAMAPSELRRAMS